MPGEGCRAALVSASAMQDVVKAAAFLREAIALLDGAGENLAAAAAHHALTMIDVEAGEFGDGDEPPVNPV